LTYLDYRQGRAPETDYMIALGTASAGMIPYVGIFTAAGQLQWDRGKVDKEAFWAEVESIPPWLKRILAGQR
jgi:hypothetical protein